MAVDTTVPLDCILEPHYNLYKGHISKLMICMFSWAPFLKSADLQLQDISTTISKFNLMAQLLNKVQLTLEQVILM